MTTLTTREADVLRIMRSVARNPFTDRFGITWAGLDLIDILDLTDLTQDQLARVVRSLKKKDLCSGPRSFYFLVRV